MIKTERATHSETNEHIDLGANDKYGRPIGALIIRYIAVHTEASADARQWYQTAPGEYFALEYKATRNGKQYGGGYVSPRMFDTEAKREAAVETYLAGARRRATASQPCRR